MRVSSLAGVAALGLLVGLASCDSNDENSNTQTASSAGHAGTEMKPPFNYGTGGQNGGSDVDSGGEWSVDGPEGWPDVGTGGSVSKPPPGSGGTGGGGGAPSGDCDIVTLGETKGGVEAPDGMHDLGFYFAKISPNIVGAGPDSLSLDLKDLAPGTFNLASSVNAYLSTCKQCVSAKTDHDGATAKTFWQQSGSIVITTSATNLKDGLLEATLQNVSLVEVTVSIVGDQPTATLVPGGRCIKIENEKLEIKPVAGWTCQPGFFDAGAGDLCDCACGLWDPDCDISGIKVSHCAPGATCEKSGESSVCVEEIAGWTCPASSYTDDKCDCTCGAWDPKCDVPGARADDCPLAGATCQKVSNAPVCTGGVAGWTCAKSAYNNGNCDCNCGAWDIDCDVSSLDPNGCLVGQTCEKNTGGLPECVTPTPIVGWDCHPAYFQDGSRCDCECGIWDPDCEIPGAPVHGCPLSGAFCEDDAGYGMCI